MSSAVATLVAIMQNASCGERMLIACQLRLSTSTIVLFSMSVIKYLACRAEALAAVSARLRTSCFGVAAFALHYVLSEGWCLFFVKLHSTGV